MKNNPGRCLSLLLLFGLISCAPKTSSAPLSSLSAVSSASSSETPASSTTVDDDTYQEEKPVMPTDEELAKEDTVTTYDNKAKVPAVNGAVETADPFVYRFNGVYYLYPTTGGKYVRGYKSRDLVTWEPVENGSLPTGIVYSYATDSNAPSSETPFAPEVTYFNGVFYMITSPSGNGHYLLSSDSPEGPFTCISKNVGRNIDGSFFIDSDEKIYLFGADSGSIDAYELNDDFTSFTAVNGEEKTYPLTSCKVGNWTEGPYMLKRNGAYYLTYCGAHYLSRDYRVDYAYGVPGGDPLKSSTYTREDTIAVSTSDAFNSLGHSCTVLGPDLDSYYLCYHDMEAGANRFLNFSRLSFNGSTMSANSVTPTGAVGLDEADFSVDDASGLTEEGDYLLSPATADTFTAEFNTIGEGKMIFSYLDAENYSYLLFADNTIKVMKVLAGEEKEKLSIPLTHTFDTSVFHTFRIQYRHGLMNLYFDSMEKAVEVPVAFKGGRIGYRKDNGFTQIGFTAYSHVALGDSDRTYAADSVSLADSYDERLSYLTDGSGMSATKSGDYVHALSENLTLSNAGDLATYHCYARENGKYAIELRYPTASLGKRIGLRLDGGDVQEVTLSADVPGYKRGDVLAPVLELTLTAGPHHLSLVNVGDPISISEIHYEKVPETEDQNVAITFNSSANLSDMVTRGSLNLSAKGIQSDDQHAVGVFTKSSFRDRTYETTLTPTSFQSTGFAGLLVNVSDYAKNYSDDADGGDNRDSFRGLEFVVDGSLATLIRVDYNFTTTYQSKSYPLTMGKAITLKAVAKGNHYQFYINDVLVMESEMNVANLQGQAGVFASDCSVAIQDFQLS